MPLTDRDRSEDYIVDRVREFVAAGTSLTAATVLDAETTGNEHLPLTGEYITVLLGDISPVGKPDVLTQVSDGVPQTIARSWQEVTAYIDFVRFPDPINKAQVFQAWLILQEARTAAYQVGITPIDVLAIRDVTEITSGRHERRAQMELRFGIVTETALVTESVIDEVDIQGYFDDHEVDIDTDR